jgi:Tfp pilus assembly protein PilF
MTANSMNNFVSVLEDRYGNKLSTSSSTARDAYVLGVDKLLSAGWGIDQAFREAIAADEDFALGHVALARSLQVLGRGGEARAPLERALALAPATTAREQSHIAIFAKILSGQGIDAISMIAEHVKHWPRDAMVVAPATGVFGLIAFSGRADREVEQLAMLEPLARHYGDDWWFRTVLAFAEIELQKHDSGLKNIETALRGFPRNAHAAHIKAHLFYEKGQREEGFAYLDQWNATYPKEGQLHCHISWHLALWSLETGRRDQAWKIYREALHPGGSWGPQINVLTDCASFLARAGDGRRAAISGIVERDQPVCGKVVSQFRDHLCRYTQCACLCDGRRRGCTCKDHREPKRTRCGHSGTHRARVRRFGKERLDAGRR